MKKYILMFIGMPLCLVMTKAEEQLPSVKLKSFNIEYSAVLEYDSKSSEVGIKFKIKNNTEEVLYTTNYQIPWAAPSPADMKIFLSGDFKPKSPSEFWSATAWSLGEVPLELLTINPGDEIEGGFPLSRIYHNIKIARNKRMVYVLWRTDLKFYKQNNENLLTDTLRRSRAFNILLGKISPNINEQIGGFLTIIQE
jgi:hypothetical protein